MSLVLAVVLYLFLNLRLKLKTLYERVIHWAIVIAYPIGAGDKKASGDWSLWAGDQLHDTLYISKSNTNLSYPIPNPTQTK